MNKFLYIGQNSIGTTSSMRFSYLKEILHGYTFRVIDTNIPFNSSGNILKSLTFRYKIGPLISKINNYILSQLENNTTYDLVWIDKGVYLNDDLMRKIRLNSKQLIHFTPDPAFYFHKSNKFFNSIKYYDYLVTTKSYELEEYQKKSKKENIIYVTQGYDKKIHKPYYNFEEKEGLVFVGHFEKDRGKMLQLFLNNGFKITLAGKYWEGFVKKNKWHNDLNYLGTGVYGESYSKILSKGLFSWGALSRLVPELHTTRTFEIPACGTALITERNKETEQLFEEDEVLFYKNDKELFDKVYYYHKHKSELKLLIDKGCSKVSSASYDYKSILEGVLKKVLA